MILEFSKTPQIAPENRLFRGKPPRAAGTTPLVVDITPSLAAFKRYKEAKV
jgi:hypothetical protein